MKASVIYSFDLQLSVSDFKSVYLRYESAPLGCAVISQTIYRLATTECIAVHTSQATVSDRRILHGSLDHGI